MMWLGRVAGVAVVLLLWAATAVVIGFALGALVDEVPRIDTDHRDDWEDR